MSIIGPTDRVSLALRLARRKARSWGHYAVGTEHVLCGLLEEHDGVAAQVLRDAGVTEEMIVRKLHEENADAR